MNTAIRPHGACDDQAENVAAILVIFLGRFDKTEAVDVANERLSVGP